MADERVQIRDFSDREILAVMADLGSTVSPREMALQIFGVAELEDNEAEIRRQAKCVSARFGWMRRYGLVTRDEETREWSISPEGEALRSGRVAPGVAAGIERGKENSSLTLANLVGERLVRSGPIAGRAMQRELQFQITRRIRRTRGW